MKKEATMKNKKWIWIAAIIVAVLAIAGVVLGIVLSGGVGGGQNGPTGGRPQIYWNVDRAQYYDETGMSTRTPGADGKYVITFAYDGEQKELTVADKRLVNYIDTVDAMGLVFDSNGEVIDAVDVTTIAKEVAKNFYVVKVEGNVLTLNASMTLDGVTKQINCTEGTGIYAMTNLGEFKGQAVELSQFKPMDVVTVYSNDLDEITHVAIMSHPIESAIYYRVDVDYKYTWATHETTREPNEDGIYEVDFAVNGEIVTLKIKDPAVMAAIDKPTTNECHCGMIFDEEGFVIGTQPSYIGIRGKQMANQYDVTEINGDTFTAMKKTGSGIDVGTTYTNTLTADTAIYECSTGYFPHERGKEVESLQIGDRIVVFENTLGQPIQILITNRLVPGPMYYNIKTTGANTPDANGWYVLELFNGETIEQYKTKDQDMAKAAAKEALKGLTLDGNIILNAYPSQRVCGNDFVDHGRYNYTVTSIAGIIVTMESSDGSTSISRVLNADCQIFNMSDVRQPIGSKTELQVGDKVISVQNPSGEFAWIFVTGRTVQGAGVYYNLNRYYDANTEETTREPVDGWYTFLMAYEGKQVTLKTKSKAVATKIDKNSGRILGLIVSGGGVIEEAFDGGAATGGRQWGINLSYKGFAEDGRMEFYHRTVEGQWFQTPAENQKVYNVSNFGFNEFRGEATTLQKDDVIVTLTDPKDRGLYVYVIERACEMPLYLRANQQYNYETKETTRVPEKDGYYHVELACNGKLGTYKVKDKAIMDAIDGAASAAIGIYVRNGVVLNYINIFTVDGIDGIGPQRYNITKINGSAITLEKTVDGKKDVQTVNKASDLQVYDISNTATQFGEKATIRVGDEVATFTNKEGQMTYALIYTRFFPREKGNFALCDHCGKKVNWTSWSGGTIPQEDGHYYLAANAKGGGQNVIGTQGNKPDVVIDLNGKTLVYKNNSRAFIAYQGSTLTIMDSIGGGKLVAGGLADSNGGVIAIGNDTTFNLLGGTLELAEDHANVLAGGVLHISGDGPVVNINGGKIVSGDLKKGVGTIFMSSGVLNLSNSEVLGDNLILKSAVTANLSGKLNITALELPNNYLLDISKIDLKSTIGISARGVFTQDVSNPAAYLKVFKCAVEGGKIAVEGKALSCYIPKPDVDKIIAAADKMTFPKDGSQVETRCPSCNEVVIWLPLTKANADNRLQQANTHFYVAEDITRTGYIYGYGADVCIHLNGKTITHKNGNENADAAFIAGGNINIYGKGTVTSNVAVFAPTGGDLNVYGGKFTTNDTVLVRSGSLNMYAGELTGNVVNVSGKGLLTVRDGYIANVKITKDMLGVMGQIELIGAAKIDTLDLKSGALLSVVELKKGASIGVAANGIFTEVLKNVDAVKGYFKAAVKGGKISVVDGALSCTIPAPKVEEVIAEANKMTFPKDGSNHTAKCPACNETVTWIALTSKNASNVLVQNEAKHYYLAENVKSTGYIFSVSGEVCIHLNGKTLTHKNGNENADATFIASKNMNIMGNGTVTSDVAVFAPNGGILSVYGGKFTTTSAVLLRSGKFNMYAGELTGNAVNVSGKGVLNVCDAHIASVKITKDVLGEMGTIELNGAAKIDALDLKSGALLSTVNLTKGASIGVSADGIFTEVLSNVDEVKGYFKTAVKGGKISVVNGALSCEMPAPDVAEIVANANKMTFPKDGSNHLAVCPVCNENVAWTAITADSAYIIGSGTTAHYYVSGDITRETTLYSALGAAHIHLNGKTMKYTPNEDHKSNSAFGAVANADITLMGNGTVEATDTQFVLFPNSGTINVYGGTYKTNGARTAALYNAAGVLNLYAGEIGDSTAASVYINGGGTFNMFGGTVSGKWIMADNVAGVDNYVNIYGGTISGNGIRMNQGALNVQGGEISKIIATEGTSEIKISGAPKISNLDMTKSAVKLTVGELTNGASIGVTAEGVFTNELTNVNAVKGYFKPAVDGGEITVAGNALACTIPEPEVGDLMEQINAMTFPTDASNVTQNCPICGDSVTWTAITADSAYLIGSGTTAHYYVSGDITRETTLYSALGAAHIHLNGKTMKYTPNEDHKSNSAFGAAANADITLMGNGTVEATDTQFVLFPNSGTINVYGGTYKTNGARTAALYNAAGVLNLYAGEIGDSTAASVYINGGGTFNMFGGTVSGKWIMADNVAGVDNYVNIYGGTISGNGIRMNQGMLAVEGGEISKIIATEGTSEIKISGAPKISNLDMTKSAVKLTVGELTNGASIGVTAEGVFTNELTNAEAVKGYFYPAVDGGEITVVGNALACTIPEPEVGDLMDQINAMTFPTDASNVTQNCPICGDSVTWTAITADSAYLIGSSTTAHYYVSGDITRETTLYSALGAAHIHLNGKTMKYNPNADHKNNSAFGATAGKDITLMGNGTVESISTQFVLFPNSGTINVYGGTYKTNGDRAAALYHADSVLNLYAGEIGDSNAASVYINGGGAFNMFGGTVSGKWIIADSVAGVDNYVNIYGGTISGNGIRMNQGMLAVEGGEISKILTSAGTKEIKISGAPVIANLDMLNSAVVANVGALTQGARIGVSANGVFTIVLANAEATKNYFYPAVEGGVISVVDGALACTTPEPSIEDIIAEINAMTFPTDGSNVKKYCPVCEDEVTWMALDSSNVGNQLVQNNARHFYVAEDITRTGYIFAITGDVCVHLNGKTITHRNGNPNPDSTFIAGKNLNIMGNGTVTSDVSVLQGNGGILSIYGGNFTSASNMFCRSGTINMYAGTLTGGKVLVGNTGNLNIYNATIASVEVEASSTGAVSLYDKAKVNSLKLSNGKKLGAIELTNGASIGIIGNGVFTADFANAAAAEAAKAFFYAVENGAEIQIDGLALSYLKGTVAPEETTPTQPEQTEPTTPSQPEQTEPTTPAEPLTPEEIIAAAQAMTFPASGNYEAPCPHCGGTENVTWKPLTGTTGALFGGHYYVDAETVERTTVISAYYGEVCLHLNGNAINTTGRGVFETSNYGINVMGDGVVTTNKTIFETVKFETNVYGGTYSTTAGSIVSLQNNANFNVYGGYFGDTTAITVWTDGSFNVYGGEIASPTLIVPNGENAIVNVSGGEITGAGISMNNGTINVTGGEISKIVRTASTKAINISGNAKIAELDLSRGTALVTVGQLTDGASIGVKGNGVFTADFADATAAEAAKAYFSAVENNKEIQVEGLALSCTTAAAPSEPTTPSQPEETEPTTPSQPEETEPTTPSQPEETEPTQPAESIKPADVYEAAKEMDFSGTLPTTCPFCNEAATWKSVADLTGNAVVGTKSHYYVPDNDGDGKFDLEYFIFAYNADVCLHLNGQEVTYVGTADSMLISNKVMTIMGDGKINGKARPAASANEGILNLCGGTYYATENASAILMNKAVSVVNLYDGEIGESLEQSVYIQHGTFNMYGGTVSGKTVNVKEGDSAAYIYDGTISGAGITINKNMAEINGGTVSKVVVTGGSTLTINGGNVASVEAAENATVRLSGKPVVGNLTLAQGVKATVGALESGADITVTAEGVFTGEFASEAAAQAAKAYFKASNPEYGIFVQGKALACGEAERTFETIIAEANAMTFPASGNYDAPCPHCDGEENVTWKPLTGTTGALFGGHYYVDAETVERTTVISAYYGEVCLHLNGNAINSTGRGVFETSNYGVNVMGNGVVTTNKTIFETVKFDTNVYGGTYSTTAGSIVSLQNNANFNVYGGYFGDTTAITVWTAGSFNVYGGEIACPTLIVPNGENAIVNVSGGKITGAGISMNNGTINVTGGEISKIVRTAVTKAINISGNPKIATLDLTVGSALVTVGELTNGASIGVKGSGVFTADFANAAAAEAAKTFFSATEENMTIAVEGNALSCVAAAQPEPPTLEETINAMTFPTDGSASVQECPVCEEEVTWVALTDSNVTNQLVQTNAKHFYVAKDITRTGYIFALSADVCVHLNGKTITHQNGNVNPDSTFIAGKNMNIMGNGTVTSDVSVLQANGGTLSIYGGNFTSGSYMLCRNGAINMYGGTLTGGKVLVGNAGNLNVYDATIATVEVEASSTGAVSLYGAAKVNSLKLASGKKLGAIELTEGALIGINADGVFTADFADVAAAEAALAFFSATEEKTTIAVEGKALVCNVVEPTLEETINAMTFPTDGSNSVQFCPVCKEEVTWTAIKADTGALIGGEGKHYYISADMERSTTLITYHGAACVHLNGKTITKNTSNSDSVFAAWSDKPLTIMGSGNIVGQGVNGINASMPNSTVNIYGGNITATADSAVSVTGNNSVANLIGGTIGDGNKFSVYVASNSTFNMYGGKVDSAKYIAAVQPTSKVVIEGGEITGIGISMNDGALEVTGGKISTITGNSGADEVVISGNPEIGSVNLKAITVKAIIGELTEGAQIGVYAEGVFTADFSNAAVAEYAKAFFFATEDAHQIVVNGNALACEAIAAA